MSIELSAPRSFRGTPWRRTRKKLGHVLLNVVLWVMAFACVFPFLWTLSTALKPENNALTGNFFFGYPLTWSNFSEAWHFFPFGRFMINSAVMAVGGVLVTLTVATTGGYAFARLRFPWRDRIFFLYIATLLIPASVTVIPLFLITRDLHMYNSYWGLIFPISFGAFGTFFMRQFFRTLPNELSDSAKIDGASEARIFFLIMLPLVRPAAAVLGVFTFIADWGNFLWPLIATQSTNLSTLTLGLSSFQSQYGSYWSYMMAGTLLAILPTVILVIILQKYLVRGLAFTAFGGR
jgi:multiple sugar transport system permease protein